MADIPTIDVPGLYAVIGPSAQIIWSMTRTCKEEAAGFADQYEGCLVVRLRTARERELERLLRRYRDETPLGHQPHMISLAVELVLGESGR